MKHAFEVVSFTDAGRQTVRRARLAREEEERVSLEAIRDNWETVLGDLRDRGLLNGEASDE